MFNEDSINALIKIYKNDEKYLSRIEKCLISFEEYHTQIFTLELWIKLYSNSYMDKNEHAKKSAELDKIRTTYHNAILGNVAMLNKLAEINNLSAVYDGVVSKERPYRREVADAVLEYVENIIKNRC